MHREGPQVFPSNLFDSLYHNKTECCKHCHERAFQRFNRVEEHLTLHDFAGFW